MAGYLLQRSQVLPISLDEAWKFFSAPTNLAEITPPRMGFLIRAPFDGRPAHAGQQITYTVRPVLGIPLRWTSLIEEVVVPFKFVDKQLVGPYKRWWHEHTFEEHVDGVLIRDRVEYELPFGFLGQLAHAIFVKAQLKSIFDFLEAKLKVIFPRDANRSRSGVV